LSVITLGVDPGLTGAICALDSKGCVLLCEDLPIIRDGALKWVDSDALLSIILSVKSAGQEMSAVVERQSARPGQGVSSSFSIGTTFGSLLATIQIARASLQFCTAAKWKRDLGLSNDKNASIDKARLLFPIADLSLKKHHGRAEALLIAHWALNRRKIAEFSREVPEDSDIREWRKWKQGKQGATDI
jgi:crossover junction endodeoxyribonuclease RuvC